MEGVSAWPNDEPPSWLDYDLESVYKSVCEEYSSQCTVVLQNTQKLQPYDDLFYTSVIIGGKVEARAMLDTGSMACTMSSKILSKLLSTGVLSNLSLAPTDVVLVGCGGTRTNPLGVCELDLNVYGCHVTVPTLVVKGQGDDLILGSNLLKHLILQLRSSELLISASERECDINEKNKLLDLLANVEKWKNGTVPDLVGTVKNKKAVSLEPMTENLVWGKLQSTHDLSAGSAVILEPSRVKSQST